MTAFLQGVPRYRFLTGFGTGAVRVIYPDASGIQGSTGPRFALTPDLNCTEANITARNGDLTVNGFSYKGMGLKPLANVQLQYTLAANPQESDWLPLWYGEVRVGGNPYDYSGESQVWRGLFKRFSEMIVTTGDAVVEADAGATVRQLVQDVLTAGEEIDPGVILFDAARVPDLGVKFTLAANQQFILGALLDQIVTDALSKLTIKLAWGVGPDRTFFFGPSTTGTLTLTSDDLHIVDMKAPVAETPCNSVRWALGRLTDGRVLYYRSTYRAFYTAEQGPIGRRSITQTPPTGVQAIIPVQDTLKTTGTASSGTGGSVGSAEDGTTDSAPDSTRMTDANPQTYYKVTPPDSNGVSISWTATGPVYEWTVSAISKGLKNLRLTVDYYGKTKTYAPKVTTKQVTNPGPSNSYYITTNPDAMTFDSLTVSESWPTGTVFTLQTDGSDGYDGPRYLAAFRFGLFGIDTALLDSQAAYFYNLPHPAPAEIECSGWLEPETLKPMVSLPLQTGTTYTENVASYEYRLSNAGGLLLGILPGQADDPATLARSALIKRNAQTTAVQVATGLAAALSP